MESTHYMDRPLTGRVALVTGGGHRVGEALARALAGAGVDLVVHAHRSIEKAEQLASEVETRAVAIAADLSQASAAAALFDRAAGLGFHPDIVVHSAAGFLRRDPLATTAEDWDQVFALNLRSFFLLSTELARRRRDGGGDLVAITDAAAIELWPGYLAHSVSKAALVALVRGLAKALAPSFRVNAVMPGPVLPPEGTSEVERALMAERTLLKRLGRPADVAQAVLFLLTCGFATGSVVEVTGGSTLWRGTAEVGDRFPTDGSA